MKRCTSVLICLLLLGALVPGLHAGAAADLSPGSRVTAGLYPQSRVTDPALIARLDAVGPGDVKLNGVMYTPMDGEWFRFDPIEWRVLESDADTVLLLADKVLDAHASGTFTVSLGGSLIDEKGINEFIYWLEEQVCLRCFGLDVNYWDYLQPIPIDLTVKLGILSIPFAAFFNAWVYGSTLSEDDFTKGKYGFGSAQSRVAAPTDYAVAAGVYTDGTSARWWALNCTLLSSNLVNYTFGLGTGVDYNGSVGGFRPSYDDSRMGLRPIVRLKRADLSPPPVTFHANGGENAPPPQPVPYGETLVLTAQEPVRQGWEFLGWSEDPDAQEPEYLPGHTWFGNPQVLYGYEYTLSRPLDLYAVWGTRLGPVNGVTITAPAGVLPEEVTGMTAEKANPFNYRITEGTPIESWEIKLIPADVQPNGFVTVRIPVPASVGPANLAKLKVFYCASPISSVDMNARLVPGVDGKWYMEFETDHFSLYVLADSSGGGQIGSWWANLPAFLQWILRYLLFGWIWMRVI